MGSLPIHLLNKKIIDAVSVAGDTTSDSLEVKEAVSIAVQAIWAGSSPSGTVSIQASNDGTNFKELSGGSITVSGNTGNDLKNFADCGFAYLRAVYTHSSGSGTLTVQVNAKRN